MRLLLMLAILFFICPISSLLYANEKNDDIQYEFKRSETYYSFRGSFVVDADYECLVNVLFDFKHIKNFVNNAEDIILVQHKKNWYDVCYVFKKFFITHKSVYRKTLKLDENKIVFEMLPENKSSMLFPTFISSSGYYKIIAQKTAYKVEYFQECKIKPSFMKDIYIKSAEKEAVDFLSELKKYVQRTCH